MEFLAYIFLHTSYWLPKCSIHRKSFTFTRISSWLFPTGVLDPLGWGAYILSFTDRLFSCISIFRISIYFYVCVCVVCVCVHWLVGFYGRSTVEGYLTPNLSLCKLSVLFSLAWVHSLIVKNISISSYSVYSNSSNAANSV